MTSAVLLAVASSGVSELATAENDAGDAFFTRTRTTTVACAPGSKVAAVTFSPNPSCSTVPSVVVASNTSAFDGSTMPKLAFSAGNGPRFRNTKVNRALLPTTGVFVSACTLTDRSATVPTRNDVGLDAVPFAVVTVIGPLVARITKK